MRIDSVDMWYLTMPQVLDIGDGSQDMVLVRVRAGDVTGWGECEASPVPTIAALVAPMSHSKCLPVAASVIGQELSSPADIARISETVAERSLDLLQAPHTYAGIEIALWDILGKVRQVPVYELLGFSDVHGKIPYASVLFGDSAQETLDKGRAITAQGYRAVKFGWGPFGAGTLAEDVDQLRAAREGVGPDGILLIDAGTVWGDDVSLAVPRLQALADVGATWLEEPFRGSAVAAYGELAAQSPVALAGGEGAHNRHVAEHLIDHGGLGYVQIDTGRIGGIGPSHQVAQYAHERGVQFVNHTFTTHLALSASLQPFAGFAGDTLAEYPVEQKPLAQAVTADRIERDAEGLIRPPAEPGLGINVDLDALRPYVVDLRIEVAGREIYTTPPLGD